MPSDHRRRDTIVVGGGIIGATTLWELSRRDVPAMLLEASTFGCESTGKSAAIVRTHYSNPEVVRMAVRSREALKNAPELLGSKPIYDAAGWLFLVDDDNADIARSNRIMQQEQGAASDEVPLDELPELVPGMSTTGVAYALYEQESGFADPIATTNAYIDAARRNGALALDHSRVESIIVEDDRVRGIVCGGQRIECETVVLAAGAWSVKLAADIGVALPVGIYREQDVIFDTDVRAPIRFAVSNQVDRVYMRPLLEQGDSLVLVGRGFPKPYETADPDDYCHDVDRGFEEDVRARAVARIPTLDRMVRVDSRVGLYSVPPDWHPILGRVAAVEGLVVATGGSGHCFKLGPAIGELIASDVTGESADFADIRSFALGRFETGRLFVSTFGGNRG